MTHSKTCSIDGCERKWHCREWCKIHYERNRIHGNPLHSGSNAAPGPLTEKVCTGCSRTLAAEDFYPHKRNRSGLSSRCRACMKAYADANRERRAACEAEYRTRPEVADRRRAQQAEYLSRPEVAARRKAVQRDRYESNRERIIAQTRAYSQANPHVNWEAGYRGRCAQYGLDPVIDSFTREELIDYWGNGERCIYCDGPFEQIDHHVAVAIGGAHNIENVMPSCADCNRAAMNGQKAQAQKGE